AARRFTRLGGLARRSRVCCCLKIVSELRSAPHAVLQGAPAREAMPQKPTTRQAHGPKIVLKFRGIALNKRWKFFCTARAKNRPRRPAASPHSPKFPEKIRKQRFQR